MRRVVQSAFERGHFDDRLAKTLIILIPKVDPPTRRKDLRPRSLCNVVAKLTTNVFVNQIRPFFNKIVSSF